MTPLRIGTRDSALAVAQANILIQAIRRADPALTVELVTRKTTGDRILDRTLDKVGGKGLFVKELDEALLAGEADLCVHSCKDLPVPAHPDLPLVALSARADARDVLVLPPGREQPDPALPVGCSSTRRRAQFAALHPGLRVEPVRGNVLTRLRKLDGGEYGALLLAAAGLQRLGLDSRVSRHFAVDEMLPAAGQGVLAVQARPGEDYTALLRHFDDPCAWDCVQAERAFVQALDGGCSEPVAAYAQVAGGELRLQGLVLDLAGGVHRDAMHGPREQAARIGERLAARLREWRDQR